jgi:hypothetical protein
MAAWVECLRAAPARLVAPVDQLVRAIGLLASRQDTGAGEKTHGGGWQAQVDAARWYLPPTTASERVPETPDATSAELPIVYGIDRIVLLVRDPRTLFAYWETTAASRAQVLARVAAPAACEALRVWTEPGAGGADRDPFAGIEITPVAGVTSAYVEGLVPGTAYRAAIGLRRPDGAFVSLARSTVVTTPRGAPSPDQTVRWVELERRAR